MDKNIITKFCKGFGVCKYKNLVIVANTVNGQNFKMTEECYAILKKLVESKVKISEFLDYFESEEDRKYFEMVLAFLLKKEILVPIDQNNNDIDISLELTNRCNLRCKHCCVDACTVSQNNDMSTEEWKGIIDKLMELPIGMLTFTGGEPMLRTDFFDIVRYAKGILTGQMRKAVHLSGEMAFLSER